jgi:hypothetical protein
MFRFHRPHATGMLCLVGLLVAISASPAWAQRAGTAEAFVGEPFGVGTITVRLDDRFAYRPDVRNFELSEAGGRVFYPVFSERRRVLSTEPRSRVRLMRVHFLFRGNEPLDVQLRVRTGETFRHRIEPEVNRAANRRNRDSYSDRLQAWWELYRQAASDRIDWHVHHRQLDNYLVAMLAPRLELHPPNPQKRWSKHADLELALAPMMGSESVRLALQRDAFLDDAQRRQRPDQPLPESVSQSPASVPDVLEDVKIEPIAMRVPAECFYLHCGSYSNLRWLQEKSDEVGRLSRQMSAAGGLDDGRATRFESQLAVYPPTVAALVVDTLISDAAIIGTDPFFHDGAAFGLLFESRNNELLTAQFQANRQQARNENPDATDETVRIADRDVSLLSTPDNRLRSFYVVDGNYHLITTSQAIVRRFLETADERDALGALAEFRHARDTMPVQGDRFLSLYLSEPFQRQLVSPKYRIELKRRTQAAGDIELVHLARLAAESEGQDADSIPALIAGGFLPKNFETRPDGSQAVLHDDGRVEDSMRGARRTFLPIPDVEIETVTRSEVGDYEEFARMYRKQWQRMDPVIVGISIQPPPNRDRERLVFDVQVTPYSRQRLAFLSQILAPADTQRLTRVPGDLATIEGRWAAPLAPPDARGAGRVFAGLRDFEPMFRITNGEVKRSLLMLHDVRAYYGADRRYGWMFGDPTQADEDGYLRRNGVGGAGLLAWALWSRHRNGLHVESRHREVLEVVTSSLKFEEAERPAQLRLRIADLSQSEFARLLNAYAYVRARRVSAGNTAFLNTLIEQLRVSPEQALETAERSLGALIVCPLGGVYELENEDAPLTEWRSHAWEHESMYDVNTIPDWYRAPLPDRLRNFELEFNMDPAKLSARIELEMQREIRK